MILLFMISQGRGSQSNSSTILETKARIIRRGLMACGHRLQSGSKNPQAIPLISKAVEQRLHVCLFLQPRNAARTHKHIQELRHMQIAPGIKTKMLRQSSLSPSQAPGKPAPSTLQVPLDSPGVARLPAKSRGCLNSAPPDAPVLETRASPTALASQEDTTAAQKAEKPLKCINCL